jgi:hypothetical protein
LQPIPVRLGYSQLRSVKHEGRGDDSGNTFDLLKVDRVKTVFIGQVKHSLDKGGTVLRGDRRREVTGTSPPADGNASQRSVVMSLLDELRDEGRPRAIKTESRGVLGCDTKMLIRRLDLRAKRRIGRDLRKGPGDETVFLPVNAG